jgi:hypothetical protein
MTLCAHTKTVQACTAPIQILYSETQSSSLFPLLPLSLCLGSRGLVAVAPTPRRPVVIVDNIATHLHGKLCLLQHTPEVLVAGVDELHGLELGFVAYAGVAACIEQDVDDGEACGSPLGGAELVDVANGLVQGRVGLDAVELVNLEPLLVEQRVEDVVAAVGCGEVQTAVADAVAGAVQLAGDMVGGLLAGLCGGRGQLGDGLLEQGRVVAAAGFEDELAGGGALGGVVSWDGQEGSAGACTSSSAIVSARGWGVAGLAVGWAGGVLAGAQTDGERRRARRARRGGKRRGRGLGTKPSSQDEDGPAAHVRRPGMSGLYTAPGRALSRCLAASLSAVLPAPPRLRRHRLVPVAALQW